MRLADAFNERLKALSVPVAWPNVNFKPPKDGLFLDPQLFRNRPDRITIDGHHRFLGFFQVVVASPEGRGTNAADEMAYKVADLFPVDDRITADDGDARVTEAPHIEGGFFEEGRWRVPVSVYYEQLGGKG